MSARKYAEGTTVAVGKSRGEVDSILRAWGCNALRWTDDFDNRVVTLEFMWEFEGQPFPTRFTIALPDMSKNPQGRTRTKAQRESFEDKEWRRLHRVLFEWLKMCFNAIDVGLVSAAQVFMPFLVGSDGQTLGQAFLPKLPTLLTTTASNFLALPEGELVQ